MVCVQGFGFVLYGSDQGLGLRGLGFFSSKWLWKYEDDKEFWDRRALLTANCGVEPTLEADVLTRRVVLVES